MAEINDLVPIDDNNTARWPEGMPPSDVNNAGRADEGILARWHRDTNASLVSTGTSTAYTLTTNQTLTAYYDGLEIAFFAHVACGNNPTLQLGALTAAALQTADGVALSSGDIPINSVVNVISQNNSTTPTWRIMNTPAGSQVAQQVITTRGDIIRGDTSGNRERYGIGNAKDVLTVSDDGLDAVWAESRLPLGYIDGLELSTAADADHDMTMSTGVCRNDADSANVELTASLTKQIDALFGKGDNNGGLFTGTVAPDTSYHACIVTEDSSGDPDWGWDTDVGGANTPTGFTFERRVGSRYTDSSSNLVKTYQSGSLVRLDVPVLDFNAPPGGSANTVTLSVPLGIIVYPLLTVGVISNLAAESPGYGLVTALAQPDTAPGPLLYHFSGGGRGNDQVSVGPGNITWVPTNTSGQVRTRVSPSTVDQQRVITDGWRDSRGKR